MSKFASGMSLRHCICEFHYALLAFLGSILVRNLSRNNFGSIQNSNYMCLVDFRPDHELVCFNGYTKIKNDM